MEVILLLYEDGWTSGTRAAEDLQVGKGRDLRNHQLIYWAGCWHGGGTVRRATVPGPRG